MQAQLIMSASFILIRMKKIQYVSDLPYMYYIILNTINKY